MSYKVNHTDTANYGSIIVEDKTVNNDTSINLIGTNYAGYAKIISENFLHILENFASKESPDNPTIGQLWYNSDSAAVIPNPSLMIWNGSNWTTANNIIKSATQPTATLIGNLWVDTSSSQLNVWTGTHWQLIGPESRTDIDGKFTGLRYIDADSNPNLIRLIIELIVQDEIIAIISSADFSPNPLITGFGDIYKGINLANTYKLSGTATWASGLEVNNTKITSDKFLRRDETNPSLANGLKIQSNDGITIGSLQNTQLSITSNNKLTLANNGIISIQSTTGTIPTTISLDDNGVACNKPLVVNGGINANSSTINGDITSAGTISSNVIKSSNRIEVEANGTIIPSSTGTGSVGTGNNKWSAMNAINITCDSLTVNSPLSGSISQNISVAPSSGTTTYKLVTTGTTIKTIGDVIAVGTPTQGKDEIILNAQLSVGAITDKPQLPTHDMNVKFLVEHNSVLKTMALYQISIPVGSVMLFAGSSAPLGYLLCDGAMYSTTDYSELYLNIGTTYGAGTGTFGVPNLTANNIGNVKYYIYSGKWA